MGSKWQFKIVIEKSHPGSAGAGKVNPRTIGAVPGALGCVAEKEPRVVQESNRVFLSWMSADIHEDITEDFSNAHAEITVDDDVGICPVA